MVSLLRLSILLITLLSALQGQTDSTQAIKFAWLTDTHVGARTGEEDLRIVVEDINKQNAIDFVIVSGDVSELDAEENLPSAKRILDSLSHPYYIIPGNHDTKWSSSGGGHFEALWGSDRFNFEVGEFRFIGYHQGPMLRMGAGYIDPDDISWVDSILQALPNPDQKIFLVQHYPLNPSVDNWHQLRDVVDPFNIQAILHGHGHRNRTTSYEGIPGIMSRSILRRGDQPTGYTIAELNTNQASFTERIPLADSLFHWHDMTLGERHSLDSLKLPYPDYSINENSSVKIIWQNETKSMITSAPSISKGKVYVTTNRGGVFAYDQRDGKTLWSWKGGQAIHSTPAIKGSRIIFGSVDSLITCLSTKTGKLIWQVKAPAPVLSSPVIDGRKAYVGCGDGSVLSLKLRNGHEKWTFSGGNGYIETKPVIAEGLILYGAWDESFYALDVKTGRLKWQWQDGRPGLLYSPAACWPVIVENKVFIVAPDRAMTAINLQTGKTIWRETGHKVRESIGVWSSGNSIVARTMQDTVISVNASADHFQLNWKKYTSVDYDIAPNALIEADEHIFISTDGGYVICLEAKSGETLWGYRISDGLVNTLAAIDGSNVVSTATDGRVSLLRYEK